MERSRFSHISSSDDRMTIWSSEYSLATIVAERPFDDAGFDYFEVKIVSPGGQSIITMGLCPRGYDRDRQPGWDSGSIGYHGDDGKVFHSTGWGSSFGPCYSTSSGEVVGCGINSDNNTIYFTHNGRLLPGSFTNNLPTPIYPAVGMRSNGARVEINFGDSPFRYEEKNVAKGPMPEIGAVETSPNHEHPMTFQDAGAGSYRVCDACGRKARRMWRSNSESVFDLCVSCFPTKFEKGEKSLADAISRYNSEYYCTVKKIEANATTKRLFVHFEVRGDNSLGAIQYPSGNEVKTSGIAVASLGNSWRVQDTSRCMDGALIYDLTNFEKNKSYTFQYGSGGYSAVPLFTLNDDMVKTLNLTSLFPLEFVDEDINADNLIDNPVAARAHTAWTQQATGGDGWSLAMTLPPSIAKGRAWSTSFGWCTASQRVHLVDKGKETAALDAGVAITASEWHSRAGLYYLKVTLLDGSGKEIACKTTGDVTGTEEWKEEVLSFRPEETRGVRTVVFEHGGKDTTCRKGNMGPVITGSRLAVTL